MKRLNFSPISRLLITAALALPCSAFADTTPICPDAATVKAAGLYFTSRDDADNAYVVSTVGKFGKDSTIWGFGMMIPYSMAVSEQDAMNKATASLPTVSGSPEAFQDAAGTWYCLYENAHGYQTGALTPVHLD